MPLRHVADVAIRASHAFSSAACKILDQIVGMLEPGREADEAFADAEFGARLRRQPLMRRGRRMGDEALGVAEIVGDARDLQRVEAAERGRPCRP